MRSECGAEGGSGNLLHHNWSQHGISFPVLAIWWRIHGDNFSFDICLFETSINKPLHMNRMIFFYFIRIIRKHSARFQLFECAAEKAKMIFMNFQLGQRIRVKQNAVYAFVGNLIYHFFPKPFQNFHWMSSAFGKLAGFFRHLMVSLNDNVFFDTSFLNKISRDGHAKSKFKDNSAFRRCYFGKLFHIGSFPIFHNRMTKNFQSVFIKNCRRIFPCLPILKTDIYTGLVCSIANITPWRRRASEIIMPWQMVPLVRFGRIHRISSVYD